MSAAYVLTKDVKHLAAWTQDRQQDGYTRGSYRPICGGKVRDAMSTCWPESRYEDPAVVARAARLPVCRLCATTLAHLNRIAEDAS